MANRFLTNAEVEQQILKPILEVLKLVVAEHEKNHPGKPLYLVPFGWNSPMQM